MNKFLFSLATVALIFGFSGVVFAQTSDAVPSIDAYQVPVPTQVQMRGPSTGSGQGGDVRYNQDRKPMMNQGPSAGSGQAGQNKPDKQVKPPMMNQGQNQDKPNKPPMMNQGSSADSGQAGLRLGQGQMMENPNMFGAKSGAGTEREKIANTKELGNYDNVIKTGNSLYGIRKQGVAKPMFIEAAKAVCVKAAISKRAATSRVALLARHEAMIGAMDARTTCELAALDKTTAQDQSTANQACIDADQKSRDTAETAFETARSAAQLGFQTEVRVCLGLPQLVAPTGTTPVIAQ